MPEVWGRDQGGGISLCARSLVEKWCRQVVASVQKQFFESKGLKRFPIR